MYARRKKKVWLFVVGVIVLGITLISYLVVMGTGLLEGPAVTALIEVAMHDDVLVFSENTHNLPQEYQVFKATQAQLLKSPFVLMAALRKPEIAALEMVKRESADPVAWLQDNLKVSFPGDSAIMEVSLTDRNTAEAAKLVNAVVEAYMSEVVECDRSMLHRRLADLDNVLARKEREIRKRRTTMKRLADELGTGDKGTLSLKMQLALQQLNVYRSQLTRMQVDLRQLRAERTALQANLARITESSTSGSKPDAPDQPTSPAPPVAEELSKLSEQLSRIITKLADTEVSQELQDDLKKIRQRVDNLRRQQSGAERIAELKERIAELTVKIAVLTEEIKSLRETVANHQKQFERIGRSTVELDMMHAELENLEAVRKQIATKRETLEVETNARPRIRLRQKAEAMQ